MSSVRENNNNETEITTMTTTHTYFTATFTNGMTFGVES